MSLINEDDLVSQGALNRPQQLGEALDKVYLALEKILKVAKESEASIVSSKSTSKVATETSKLTKAQKDLTREQEKAGKIAKTLWMSQNEVANSAKRGAIELKKQGDALNRMDSYMARAANSSTAYAKAQQASNEQSAKAVMTYKAEAGSLNELIQKRNQLKASTASQRKDQQEDITLMRQGVISRGELNKRITDSEAIIAKNNLAIRNLNASIKEHVLTNTQLGGTYQRLTAQMEAARTKYKDLAASGTASTKQLRDQQRVYQDLATKVTTIDKAVGQFQRNVGNYPGTLRAAASGLRSFMAAFGLVSGIALFAQLMRKVVTVTKEFEKTMSGVRAITNATDEEFQQLRKSAIELGGAISGGAKAVSELQLAYSKLGYSNQEILDATAATIDLSKATGEDLAKSADIAGTTIRALGKNASETRKVADILAVGFNKTALGLDNYGEAARYVLPVAKALGISFERVVADLGTLADAGIRGSMAGTSLRKIYGALKPIAGDVGKEFNRLGEAGLSAAEAQEKFGRTAYAAGLVLVSQRDKTAALEVATKNANGEIAKMSALVSENLSGDIDKLSGAFDGLILSMEKSNTLRDFTRGLTNLFNIMSGNKAGELEGRIDVFASKIGGDFELANREIAKFVTDLKKLREETGKPIDVDNTVLKLGIRYQLTTQQANLLRMSLLEVNKALSPDEAEIQKFEQFAKGYKNFNDAVNAYRHNIGDMNLQLQEQVKNLTIDNIGKKGLFDKDIIAAKELIKNNEHILKLIAQYTNAKKESSTQVSEFDDAAIRRLASAQLDLDKFRLEQEAKVQEEIISDEKAAYEKRIAASFKLEQIRAKIAGVEREKEMLAEELSATEVVLINEEKEAKVTDAKRNGTKERTKITKEQAEEDFKIAMKSVQAQEDLAKTAGDNAILELQKRSDAEVQEIQAAVLRGEITRSQGDKRIRKAQINAAKELAYEELAVLENRLEDERTVYYEERKKLINESYLDEAEKILKLQEIEAESNEERLAIQQKIHDLKVKLTNDAYDLQENRFESELEMLAKVQQAWQAWGSAIGEIFSNVQAKRIQDLQHESDLNADRLEQDLKLTGDNEKAKEKMRNAAAKQEQQLEKQRLQAMRKAAIAEKAFAMTSAAINAASAVLVQLGSAPAITAIPRSILAGILGGLQVAAIASRPIPQYATGTDNHPGGDALFGEAGTELVKEPGKKAYLTDGPTVADLPAGTKVLPHQETIKQLALGSLTRSNSDRKGNGNDLGFLGEKMDKLTSTIKNKKELHINFSRSGVEALFAKGASRDKFLKDFYA